VFDVHLPEMLVLGLVALLVFGPERLPEVAVQAARMIKKLRGMAESARADLGVELEPHLRELKELRELDPRKLAKNYVLDPADGDGTLSGLTKKGARRKPSGAAAASAAGSADAASAASVAAAPATVGGAAAVGSGKVMDASGDSNFGLNGGTHAVGATNGAGATSSAGAANGISQTAPAVPAAMARPNRSSPSAPAGPAPFDPDAT
jgi:sec-independent protein translocase protein TatB